MSKGNHCKKVLAVSPKKKGQRKTKTIKRKLRSTKKKPLKRNQTTLKRGKHSDLICKEDMANFFYQDVRALVLHYFKGRVYSSLNDSEKEAFEGQVAVLQIRYHIQKVNRKKITDLFNSIKRTVRRQTTSSVPISLDELAPNEELKEPEIQRIQQRNQAHPLGVLTRNRACLPSPGLVPPPSLHPIGYQHKIPVFNEKDLPFTRDLDALVAQHDIEVESQEADYASDVERVQDGKDYQNWHRYFIQVFACGGNYVETVQNGNVVFSWEQVCILSKLVNVDPFDMMFYASYRYYMISNGLHLLHKDPFSFTKGNWQDIPESVPACTFGYIFPLANTLNTIGNLRNQIALVSLWRSMYPRHRHFGGSHHFYYQAIDRVLTTTDTFAGMQRLLAGRNIEAAEDQAFMEQEQIIFSHEIPNQVQPSFNPDVDQLVDLIISDEDSSTNETKNSQQ